MKGESGSAGISSRRKPKTPLPENFLPDDFSDSNRGEFEKFKSHHLAQDSRFANWSQAWRKWQLNAVEFNRERTNGRKDQSSTVISYAQAYDIRSARQLAERDEIEKERLRS